MTEDERYEKIGEAIFTLSYWWFAIKFIVSTSVIVLIPVLLLDKPWWIAPVVGIIAFLVYRLIIRNILRFVFKYK